MGWVGKGKWGKAWMEFAENGRGGGGGIIVGECYFPMNIYRVGIFAKNVPVIIHKQSCT